MTPVTEKQSKILVVFVIHEEQIIMPLECKNRLHLISIIASDLQLKSFDSNRFKTKAKYLVF